MKKIKISIFLVVLSTALYLLVFPPSLLSYRQTEVAALSLITIGMWATGIVPEYLTSLCFFLVSMLFYLAPASVIFAGFASSAVWLIFGGLVLGLAINATGLGKRTAALVARRLGGSYIKIIAGLVTAGVMFSFLMPSAMGRVVLLTPIAVVLSEQFGFAKGSNGRTGVILAVIMGSFLPAFAVLPANVPNMVLSGMAESQYHISLLYGPYLFLHFPVMGFLRALIMIFIIVRLYPDTPARTMHAESEGLASRLSVQERILAAVLVALLILWGTDFIHHMSPAWVALSGAVFLLLPPVSIVTTKMFNQKMNWASIIFVAGILGLGTLINQSGLGHRLAGAIIKFLPVGPGREFVDYICVILASAATGVVTTLPGVPAVLTPFADILAKATGFSVESVLMMQVLGFATVIFPYQAPPIVVGMQLSEERFSTALKFCLIMTVATVLFLFPLDFLWWRIQGMI